MKKFKKVVAMLVASCMCIGVVALATGCGKKDDKFSVSVFAYKYDDDYITTVRTALETRFKEHADKLEVTFYNGEGNQNTQSTSIDTAITKGTDLLIINAVDYQSAGDALAKKAKDANLPAIFFNREVSNSAVNLSDNFCFVGTDPAAPGYMLGKMIADLVKTDDLFAKYDKNGDGKIQYAMFRAEVGNAEADGRTTYSVSEANRLIKENTALTKANKDGNVLQRVSADQMAEWDSGKANNLMSSLFQIDSNGIPNVELVICNNDAMAIGVISALKDKGFNEPKSRTEHPESYIPVYGVDALATALDAMRNGTMEGTVKQDGDAMAKAIVEISLNIMNEKGLLDGTSYKFEEGTRKLRIPYAPVTDVN